MPVLTRLRACDSAAEPLNVRAMRADDVVAASRLLLSVFTEDEDINIVSRALILGEHVVGLRERGAQNVILVCQEPSSKELIGASPPSALTLYSALRNAESRKPSNVHSAAEFYQTTPPGPQA